MTSTQIILDNNNIKSNHKQLNGPSINKNVHVDYEKNKLIISTKYSSENNSESNRNNITKSKTFISQRQQQPFNVNKMNNSNAKDVISNKIDKSKSHNSIVKIINNELQETLDTVNQRVYVSTHNLKLYADQPKEFPPVDQSIPIPHESQNFSFRNFLIESNSFNEFDESLSINSSPTSLEILPSSSSTSSSPSNSNNDDISLANIQEMEESMNQKYSEFKNKTKKDTSFDEDLKFNEDIFNSIETINLKDQLLVQEKSLITIKGEFSDFKKEIARNTLPSNNSGTFRTKKRVSFNDSLVKIHLIPNIENLIKDESYKLNNETDTDDFKETNEKLIEEENDNIYLKPTDESLTSNLNIKQVKINSESSNFVVQENFTQKISDSKEETSRKPYSQTVTLVLNKSSPNDNDLIVIEPNIKRINIEEATRLNETQDNDKSKNFQTENTNNSESNPNNQLYENVSKIFCVHNQPQLHTRLSSKLNNSNQHQHHQHHHLHHQHHHQHQQPNLADLNQLCVIGNSNMTPKIIERKKSGKNYPSQDLANKHVSSASPENRHTLSNFQYIFDTDQSINQSENSIRNDLMPPFQNKFHIKNKAATLRSSSSSEPINTYFSQQHSLPLKLINRLKTENNDNQTIKSNKSFNADGPLDLSPQLNFISNLNKLKPGLYHGQTFSADAISASNSNKETDLNTETINILPLRSANQSPSDVKFYNKKNSEKRLIFLKSDDKLDSSRARNNTISNFYFSKTNPLSSSLNKRLSLNRNFTSNHFNSNRDQQHLYQTNPRSLTSQEGYPINLIYDEANEFTNNLDSNSYSKRSISALPLLRNKLTRKSSNLKSTIDEASSIKAKPMDSPKNSNSISLSCKMLNLKMINNLTRAKTFLCNQTYPVNKAPNMSHSAIEKH